MSSKVRSSSFELLRIVAMLGIAFNHVLIQDRMLGQPLGVRSVNKVLTNFGGVGDVVFFGLTAWFLCAQQTLSIKRNWRRIWLLERQVLFYSWLFFALYCGARFGLGWFPVQLGLAKLTANTVLPLMTSLWWYPTSYCLFMLMAPFITPALRTLGRTKHAMLAATLVLVWGILPYFTPDMNYGVLLFLYLYVIISYIRWYEDELINSATVARAMVFIGLASGLAIDFIFNALIGHSNPYSYFNAPWKLPSIAVGVGLLMLAHQHQRMRSKVINAVASTMLVVYLIVTYPVCGALFAWLIKEYAAPQGPWLQLVMSALLAVVVYCLGILLDFLRQIIFRATIDRRQGHWFAVIWERTSVLANALLKRSRRHVGTLALDEK